MKINTPSHCAKLTMAYVTEKNVFSVARLMEWSLASPNIYQVENPWSIIKRVCRGECKIDSSKDLWEAVKKIFKLCQNRNYKRSGGWGG